MPTPDEVAAVFKKPRTLLSLPPGAVAPPPRHFSAPLAHCMPPDAVPILEQPLELSDFFVDLTKNPSKESDNLKHMIHKFPPPVAPVANTLPYAGTGFMVPFVFPPVPLLRPDRMLADPVLVKKRGRKSAQQLLAIANAARRSRVGVDNTDIHVTMAPLPFPLPNYMPYPLVADYATLTPPEVFARLLMALEHLPRTDMVVACAAGSIFDMRADMDAAGLTLAALELLADTRESPPPQLLESAYDDYAEYASQVDVSTVHDPHSYDRRAGKVIVDLAAKVEYLRVAAMGAERGSTVAAHHSASYEYSDRDVEHVRELEQPSELVSGGRDVVNAVGAQKERRRSELVASYGEIESFAESHRREVYASRKLALLARLRALQRSRVWFNDRTDVADGELERRMALMQAQRDVELVRLKAYLRYEKLKAAQAFYQTSNRVYKAMNTQLINRLQKLRHFFEYQQQMLRSGLDADSDLTNIRSKDSARLYNAFAEVDYLEGVKDVFRAAARSEDRGADASADNGGSGVGESDDGFDADMFRRVRTDHTHAAFVHDMMPLVTAEELKLIVGEAPQKTGPVKDASANAKSARHPIFQSPLYDRVTSGSDTNASDGGAPTFKRRPGRRAAPKPVLGDPATKQNTEAALLAKIMKQFVGPAAANADELTGDLSAIGIETRWPVK